MNATIELSREGKNRIREAVAKMDPSDFKSHLSHLEETFTHLFHDATLIAQEIGTIKEACPHRNHTVNENSKLCHDCGEFFAVKTSFSPETEAWFVEQNRLAMEQNPMIIIPAP